MNSSSDEDEEEEYDPNWFHKERAWLNAHYDVLNELYNLFRQHGAQVFGGAFFQFGDFAQFVQFVHANTVP